VGWCVAVAGIAYAATATADGTCPHSPVGDVAVANDELIVVRAATAALQSGDILVQLNSYSLHQCEDLARALQEAGDRHLIPVLIVRRNGALVTATLQESVAVGPEPILPAGTTGFAGPTPTFARAALAASPLPSPTAVAAPPPGSSRSFDALVSALQAFSQQPPLLTSRPYLDRLAALRGTYETLRAQDPRVAAAEPIMDYYATVAAILAYKDEHVKDEGGGDTGQRVEGRRRQTDVAFSYLSDGPVPGWIQHYAFLAPAVVREPITRGDWELTGRWVPDEAVRLLLERAKMATEALASGTAHAQE